MAKVTPCLWFDGDAEQAATFYTSLLPHSQIDHVQRAPADYPERLDIAAVERAAAGGE